MLFGNVSNEPVHFGPEGKGRGGLETSGLYRPCVLCAGYSMMGEACSFGYQVLCTSPSDCGPMLTEISRNTIPFRYRLAVSQLSSSLSGIDRLIIPLEESRVMKNEKLKSTTVRFRDSDLYLIERLQEKLGLGMIHVIRLAIRRLAENENLLSSPTIPKKR